MKTIRNTNERFGEPIEICGETLAEAVARMQAAIRDCGPEFADAVVTAGDYIEVYADLDAVPYGC